MLLVPFAPVQLMGFILSISLLSSLFYMRSAGRRLGYRRIDSTLRCFRGSDLEITTEFSNRGFLPVNNFRYSDPPGSLYPTDVPRGSINLLPGQKIRLSHRVDARQRGRFRVGPLRINGRDPLGFFRYEKIHDDYAECIVYPKVYPLEFLIETGLPAGSLKTENPLYEDVSRYKSIREYVPGDSISHISWKHSAKTGELFTREFLPTYNFSTLLVLNLVAADYELKQRYARIERMIELAASLTFYICREKQQTGLICAGRTESGESRMSFPIAGKEEHAMQILDSLACVSALLEGNFLESMMAGLYDVPWNSRIVYIGPYLEEKLFKSFINLWKPGRKIDFLFCDVSGQNLPPSSRIHRFFKINEYGEYEFDSSVQK